MKKKIYFFTILVIVVLFSLTIPSLAKYVLDDNIELSVYIDKTPPIINLESNNKSENYPKTDLDNVIGKNSDTKATTSDNVAVKENRYYYNSTVPNFDGVEAQNFESEKTFTEDGYYKIESEDTSGNTTEIVVLIDKTPPDITVNYYKKGEEPKEIAKTEVISVAGTKKYKNAEQIAEVASNTPMTIAGSIDVYDESQFMNAINNKYSQIITHNSLNFSNSINVNGSGSFINVQSGGNLTLNSMVIDTNTFSKGRGTTAINVQSGGKVIFTTTSIIDCGNNNMGLLINNGATAEMHSSYIVGGTKGILVKDNGNLIFGTGSNEIASAGTGIFFENFNATCNINNSNIKIHNCTNGIIHESGEGTIKVSNANIYNNSSNGILNKTGTLELSGGTIYSNGNGINLCDGTLSITGGTIRSNKIGIFLNGDYQNGKMTITNVNINSNSQYAIQHSKNEDGSCTILGGTISGKIYLAQKDNYVNTNDQYPSFEVTPSEYYFKRKLVKTISNEVANTELENVTMTPKDDWYKFVDKDEYIVVWRGCKVIVKYNDYFGNELSSETLTGELGDNYHATSRDIPGYDLVEVPSNADGQYTEEDIVVEFKYDLKNVAIVNYEDLLSGVKSAKYWYSEIENNFTGDGTDFENHKMFEDYGFYKVVVTNNVGLVKEITFSLNKDSLVR